MSKSSIRAKNQSARAGNIINATGLKMGGKLRANISVEKSLTDDLPAHASEDHSSSSDELSSESDNEKKSSAVPMENLPLRFGNYGVPN